MSSPLLCSIATVVALITVQPAFAEDDFHRLPFMAVTTNIIQNGDFSEPINIDRKRGRWMLLLTEKGGANFSLAIGGFAVEDNILNLQMSELKSGASESAFVIQLSQLIPPINVGKRYQLTFETKCSEPDGEFLVGVGVVLAGKMEGGLAWETVRPSTEWQPSSYEFTGADAPGGNPTATRLDFRLGKATGTLSLRNVQLIELD